MSVTILKQRKVNVDKFNELYERDRFLARIYSLDRKPYIDEVILNETSETSFQIFFSTKKYGVSKTLKRFVTSKKTIKIFVNNGRFFFSGGKIKLMPLCLYHVPSDVEKLFMERFTWIRFLKENEFDNISFNTIVKNKLYSRDKVLRYLYECHAEKALAVKKMFPVKAEWKSILKVSTNTENLNCELLSKEGLLTDACRLAFLLNEKVNLAWSVRRLKEEHDEWSRKYTKAVIEFDNEKLNIRQIFREFNDFIGGGMLTYSGELAMEGFTQKHCVASYKNYVNTGRCAIFNFEGYTAEISLSYKKGSIELAQIRGVRNCSAPDELTNRIIAKIECFNEMVKGKGYPPHKEFVAQQVDELEELPF